VLVLGEAGQALAARRLAELGFTAYAADFSPADLEVYRAAL